MKVVKAMDPDHFDNVCDMGGALLQGIVGELERRGIDPSHTAHVLMIALAGCLVEGDLDQEKMSEMLDAMKKLWAKEEDGSGYVLRTPNRAPRLEVGN